MYIKIIALKSSEKCILRGVQFLEDFSMYLWLSKDNFVVQFSFSMLFQNVKLLEKSLSADVLF